MLQIAIFLTSLLLSTVVLSIALLANIVELTEAKTILLVLILSVLGGAAFYGSEQMESGVFNKSKFFWMIIGSISGGIMAFLLIVVWVGEDKLTIPYVAISSLAGGFFGERLLKLLYLIASKKIISEAKVELTQEEIDTINNYRRTVLEARKTHKKALVEIKTRINETVDTELKKEQGKKDEQ